MKKVILSALILFAISPVFSQIDYSEFDNSKGTSMMPIIKEAEPLIQQIENEDLEIVRMEFDLVTKNGKETFRNLSSSYCYAIVALGDYRIKDIDITIYQQKNGNWVEVKKDSKEDKEAVCLIQPPVDGQYKIVISAYSFNDSYTIGHYALIICHE